MAYPDIDWQYITNQLIIDAVPRLGIEIPDAHNHNRDERAAFLRGLGFTAIQLIQVLHPAAFPAAPVPVPPPVHRPQQHIGLWKLTKKDSQEPILAFLSRAEICLTPAPITDQIRIHSLLNSSGSELGISIQTHINNGTATFLEMLQLLRAEYKISKSAAMDRFENADRSAGETYHSYGRRLKQYFMELADRPMTEFTDHEHFIKQTLFIKLIKCLPPHLATQARTYFSTNPLVSWHDLLTQVDCLQNHSSLSRTGLSNRPPRSSGQSSQLDQSNHNNEADQPTPFCEYHTSNNHWTRDCRARKWTTTRQTDAPKDQRAPIIGSVSLSDDQMDSEN
jgi:hypothetical protein